MEGSFSKPPRIRPITPLVLTQCRPISTTNFSTRSERVSKIIEKLSSSKKGFVDCPDKIKETNGTVFHSSSIQNILNKVRSFGERPATADPRGRQYGAMANRSIRCHSPTPRELSPRKGSVVDQCRSLWIERAASASKPTETKKRTCSTNETTGPSSTPSSDMHPNPTVQQSPTSGAIVDSPSTSIQKTGPEVIEKNSDKVQQFPANIENLSLTEIQEEPDSRSRLANWKPVMTSTDVETTVYKTDVGSCNEIYSSEILSSSKNFGKKKKSNKAAIDENPRRNEICLPQFSLVSPTSGLANQTIHHPNKFEHSSTDNEEATTVYNSVLAKLLEEPGIIKDDAGEIAFCSDIHREVLTCDSENESKSANRVAHIPGGHKSSEAPVESIRTCDCDDKKNKETLNPAELQTKKVEESSAESPVFDIYGQRNDGKIEQNDDVVFSDQVHQSKVIPAFPHQCDHELTKTAKIAVYEDLKKSESNDLENMVKFVVDVDASSEMKVYAEEGSVSVRTSQTSSYPSSHSSSKAEEMCPQMTSQKEESTSFRRSPIESPSLLATTVYEDAEIDVSESSSKSVSPTPEILLETTTSGKNSPTSEIFLGHCDQKPAIPKDDHNSSSTTQFLKKEESRDKTALIEELVQYLVLKCVESDGNLSETIVKPGLRAGENFRRKERKRFEKEDEEFVLLSTTACAIKNRKRREKKKLKRAQAKEEKTGEKSNTEEKVLNIAEAKENITDEKSATDEKVMITPAGPLSGDEPEDENAKYENYFKNIEDARNSESCSMDIVDLQSFMDRYYFQNISLFVSSEEIDALAKSALSFLAHCKSSWLGNESMINHIHRQAQKCREKHSSAILNVLALKKIEEDQAVESRELCEEEFFALIYGRSL